MKEKLPTVIEMLTAILSGQDTSAVVLYNKSLDRIEILGTSQSIWNRHEVGHGQTHILTMSDLTLEDIKSFDSYEVLGEL